MWKAPSPKRDAGSSIRSDAHYTLSRRRERQSPKVLMSDFTGFLMSPNWAALLEGAPFSPPRNPAGPLQKLCTIIPQALENFFQELSGFLHIGPLFTWPSQFCPFSEVTEKLKFEGACSLGRWMRRERKGREEKGRLQDDTVWWQNMYQRLELDKF